MLMVGPELPDDPVPASPEETDELVLLLPPQAAMTSAAITAGAIAHGRMNRLTVSSQRDGAFATRLVRSLEPTPHPCGWPALRTGPNRRSTAHSKPPTE